MDNFMDRVKVHALGDGEGTVLTDHSAEDWAARAFAAIISLGAHEAINDEIGEALARIIGYAPDTVVAQGTLALLAAKAAHDAGVRA
jgi:hypothetical protein